MFIEKKHGKTPLYIDGKRGDADELFHYGPANTLRLAMCKS